MNLYDIKNTYLRRAIIVAVVPPSYIIDMVSVVGAIVYGGFLDLWSELAWGTKDTIKTVKKAWIDR